MVHNTPRLAAALAFYTLLALSPMVVLVLAALSMVMGRVSAQSRIIIQAQWLFGLEGSKAVAFLLHNARRPASGWFASVVGIATLVLGASGVTGELRSGMNTIWNQGSVPVSPVRRAIYDRSFSLGMVLSLGLLPVVSLLVSTALVGTGKFFASLSSLPPIPLALTNYLILLGTVWALFALIFRYLPETRPSWQGVRWGSLITALLFTAGKTFMERYLRVSDAGSPYGAAGPLIVITLWIYYSAQVFFLGAEFARQCADRQRAKAGLDEAERTRTSPAT